MPLRPRSTGPWRLHGVERTRRATVEPATLAGVPTRVLRPLPTYQPRAGGPSPFAARQIACLRAGFMRLMTLLRAFPTERGVLNVQPAFAASP